MRELYTGAGGWFCEDESGCEARTNTVYLSREEVRQLNAAFPDEVKDGMARGTGPELMVLRGSMGQVRCDKHAPALVSAVSR